MDDTSEGAFKLLVQWLYSEELQLCGLRDNLVDHDEDDSYRTESQDLVKLWCLADKLCIPHLQNLLIEKIYEISEKWQELLTTAIDCLCGMTEKDSALRKFFVEMFALDVDANAFLKTRFPAEFLSQVAAFHAARRDSGGYGEVGDVAWKSYLVPTEEDDDRSKDIRAG